MTGDQWCEAAGGRTRRGAEAVLDQRLRVGPRGLAGHEGNPKVCMKPATATAEAMQCRALGSRLRECHRP